MRSHPSRRVLCLTSWYPPHHFGGYEVSCRDVMVGLSERGHSVDVLTSDHRHADVPDDPDGTAVHRRLRLYFQDGDLWAPSLPGRIAVERHNARVLAEVLDSVRPDVVSVWHVGALSLGLLGAVIDRGIPLVFAVSDDWTIYSPQLDPWTRATINHPRVTAPLARIAGLSHGLPPLGDAGPFCFISEATRERALRSSPWTLARTGIVYSGIDHARFATRPETSGGEERPMAPPWGPPTILYVGRVDERKGIRTLVRAVAHVPGARLVVDGRSTPEDAQRLRTWAAEAGVSERMVLQCSDPDDLPAVYRSAALCAFPSEWEEPFGLVPLEAMASGTPVVATGVGGSGEFLIDEQNCLLYPSGDDQALAASITRLLSDRDLRSRLVANGRSTASFFDVAHLTEIFESWHEFAIDGGTAPEDRTPPGRTSSDSTTVA